MSIVTIQEIGPIITTISWDHALIPAESHLLCKGWSQAENPCVAPSTFNLFPLWWHQPFTSGPVHLWRLQRPKAYLINLLMPVVETRGPHRAHVTKCWVDELGCVQHLPVQVISLALCAPWSISHIFSMESKAFCPLLSFWNARLFSFSTPN